MKYQIVYEIPTDSINCNGSSFKLLNKYSLSAEPDTVYMVCIDSFGHHQLFLDFSPHVFHPTAKKAQKRPGKKRRSKESSSAK